LKLLVVSHTPHYYSIHGSLVGWGATVREIDCLAQLFDEIIHIAPVYLSSAPPSALPYQAKNVYFHPVRPAGGENLKAKVEVGLRFPEYASAITKEARHVDFLHVRCPSNLGLLTLLLSNFDALPAYRWVKYAGNWQPNGKEPSSYALQRRILQKNYFKGVVTINGEWPKQPKHVYSFYNPCLTDAELEIGNVATHQKELSPPYQLLYVGRLESAKGVGRILQIAALLNEYGIAFELNLIGDGPEKEDFVALAKELNISKQTRFYGWKPRSELGEYYSKAHFIILPSSASEGWPKVLSEAMAYGAVPIASNVSSIPQFLKKIKTGATLDPQDVEGFAITIRHFIQHADLWKEASIAANAGANFFTYTYYLSEVKRLFKNAWNLEL